MIKRLLSLIPSNFLFWLTNALIAELDERGDVVDYPYKEIGDYDDGSEY